ncbi:hypothetical protein [Cronobacter malonaticus]|uniref:hypothetical protein n=1 Tax=Cronobacter malonaticus TaxID=413503 RepID=UPI000CFB82B2|nr:hypothetical protein [Cronobacter malonaticus]
MKLIDLLVQELPRRGGWPDGVKAIEQNPYGCLFNSVYPRQPFLFDCEEFEISDDWKAAIVTREQYEAALAAAQQPVWDGDGLPPAGCECEAKYRDAANAEWFFFRCVGVDCGIAFGWAGKEAVTLGKGSFEFRPIRSEYDKRRDEAIAALKKLKPQLVGELAGSLYDEIAAGKIPHIRIE